MHAATSLRLLLLGLLFNLSAARRTRTGSFSGVANLTTVQDPSDKSNTTLPGGWNYGRDVSCFGATLYRKPLFKQDCREAVDLFWNLYRGFQRLTITPGVAIQPDEVHAPWSRTVRTCQFKVDLTASAQSATVAMYKAELAPCTPVPGWLL